MITLLHVAASARGAASISRRVAGDLIEALSRDDPALSVSSATWRPCRRPIPPPPSSWRA